MCAEMSINIFRLKLKILIESSNCHSKALAKESPNDQLFEAKSGQLLPS